MIFSSSTFTATVLALAAVSSSARLVQGPSGNEYAKRGLDSTPSQSAQVCYTLTCPNTPTGTTPDSVTGTKTADGNLTCTYSSSPANGPCIYGDNGFYLDGPYCVSWAISSQTPCAAKRNLSRLEKKIQARQYKFKRST